MSNHFPVSQEISQSIVDELYDALSARELCALEAGETDGIEVQQAALRAAIALGYCRLFGVELAEEDGVLPPVITEAAARGLEAELDQLISAAENLSARWDETEELLERDELCLALLEGRMDSQAAYIAIEESLLEAQCEGEVPWSQYEERTGALVQRLEKLDEVMQLRENLEILSSVVAYPLLQNWRKMLAGEYRLAQFWWLSDLLQQVAEHLDKSVLDEATPPQVWQFVVQAERQRYQQVAILLGAWLRRILARQTAAAGEPEAFTLSWLSPEGHYQAVCRVIARDTLPQKLTLYFMQTTGEPAQELVNAPVWLAGIASRISPEGIAEFEVEKLRHTLEAQQLPELVVGQEQQAWLLTPDSVQLISRHGGGGNAPPGPGTT